MKEFAEREKERTEDRKNVERARRKKEAGWVALEVGRGEEEGRESPRVFGPCLPSSFVPELRLFSWPSFSRFVHPWAQGRARARERERVRVRERVTAGERGTERSRRVGGRRATEEEEEKEG